MPSLAVSVWGRGKWEPSERENEGDLGKKAGEHFSSSQKPLSCAGSPLLTKKTCKKEGPC